MLSFYILFLIPSFLIHLYKLFSIQLGPGTASLACARLIVPFALFNAVLEGANIRFKDLANSKDRISENNDVVDIIVFYSRNKVYMDSHELNFNKGDIYSLGFELFSDGVVFPDMGNSCGYIGFFDAAISNDSHVMIEILWLVKDMIEILNMSMKVFITRRESVTTLRSNSGCNTQVKTWGWDESRERKRMIQLVKRKEYRRVSTIYIPMYHILGMRREQSRHEVCWVKYMSQQ